MIRESRVIGDYGLDSLKREKDDAREVREGLECGIKLAGFNDLKEGDVLEAYKIEEVRRTFKETRHPDEPLLRMPRCLATAEKAAEAIREVVSMAILAELNDPRVRDVTVTYVEVSADLRHAKVHVSVMGDETKQQLSLARPAKRGRFPAGENRRPDRDPLYAEAEFRAGSGREAVASPLRRSCSEVLPPPEAAEADSAPKTLRSRNARRRCRNAARWRTQARQMRTS